MEEAARDRAGGGRGGGARAERGAGGLGPNARERGRCPHCRLRCPGYDWGEGRRRWRALDLATTFCYLEAEAPRVECKAHGVVVAAVPWARHDSNFTRAFENQCAWLTVNTSKTAVCELMRIAWRTLGWDLRAGDGRGDRQARPARRPHAPRDRRDLRPQGPALPHRRRRPRLRPAGLGAPGPRPSASREVPGSAGRGALRADHARLLRHGRLDHGADRRALPERRGLL